MIRVRLQIGAGEILDTFEGWGFIYMDADERTEAPIKKRESTSYAEEAGEHTDPRTVQDAFDYKVKFLIECPNRDLENANAKIASFNKALYTASYDSSIRTYKEVTFYNDYNRVKIVGLPEPIAQPTDFFRKQDGSALDCAQVELKIRVSDPSKCSFNTSLQDDPDTTTDELGIKWYNTNLNVGIFGEFRFSKALSIREDIADFVREINGEKICYYTPDNALKIVKHIATYYGSDNAYYVSDPIYMMIVLGLIDTESEDFGPEEFRTVWEPISADGDFPFSRGEVIATYPKMGYYKDGAWVDDDTVYLVDENEESFSGVIKDLISGDQEDNHIPNSAIPLKILLPVNNTFTLSTLAAPMSLRKTKSE